MKKMQTVVLSLITVLSILAGCSNSKDVTCPFLFPFAEHIGKSYDKVLEDMKLNENDLVHDRTGKCTTKDTVIFNDKEFSNYLMFDINDNTLFGGGYECNCSDIDAEAVVVLVNEISSELSKQYGNPVTYEGLPNIIANISSAEELKNADIASFVEDWDVTGEIPCTIRLTLNILPDNQYGINIEYRFSWNEDVEVWEALKERLK